MIIDIALGIVLAVIILRLLPHIIEAGMVLVSALIAFLALAICGLLIYWGVSHVEEIIIVIPIALTFVGWEYLAELIQKKTGLLRTEVGILTALAVFTAPLAWITLADLSFWFIPILVTWVSALAIVRAERNKRIKILAKEMDMQNGEGRL